MAGISHIFNIARSGIQASQQGLATTSHNITNINTKGYSRQEVVLETKRPDEGTIGSGVQVGAIRRTVDSFLENQLTAVNEDMGYITARNNFLVQTDGLFSETEQSGVSYSLTEFFNALRDVTTNPESTIQRTVLLAKAGSLTDAFVTQAQGLNQIRSDADGEISRHVETINGLTVRIASLNDEIFKAESSGREAPDLRDQRGVLINGLAELVDIEQVTMRDGIGINVGGQLLVGGNHANALSTEPDPDNPPLHNVTFVRSDGSEIPISNKIHGGKIGGLLALRDGDIVAFQDRVDRLAAVLTNEFNQQHQSGFALDGSTNNAFFSALAPQVPLASDRNTGSAIGSSLTIADPTLLTFQNYEVQFTGSSAYSVVNTATGATVTSGAYTSGSPISFDGLDVVITGTAALGDVFSLSAQKGAAQRFGVTLSNTDKIAAASTAAGIPGDNTNALALVGIHTNRQVDLGNVTLNDYHTITIGDVGSATQESELALISKNLEADQLTALRESVSGVSLDEELTNLLSFQRSFEASARMITVADELMQTILAMGG
ncbi:MAG: flagellar hook-associated protein FlgK [Nitrospirota bacterium]|nr:flagellar hook-associated protein FlgK [Nitrospirota bacterium]MDH4360481.1 flagellar hook-associated protein FlgK [Nitrospirota bacterium]MDH5573921.1 flagellar hook-associated protein FlgK [Nitrospirota bacterium]